jgi:hypothetical protein
VFRRPQQTALAYRLQGLVHIGVEGFRHASSQGHDEDSLRQTRVVALFQGFQLAGRDAQALGEGLL